MNDISYKKWLKIFCKEKLPKLKESSGLDLYIVDNRYLMHDGKKNKLDLKKEYEKYRYS